MLTGILRIPAENDDGGGDDDDEVFTICTWPVKFTLSI